MRSYRLVLLLVLVVAFVACRSECSGASCAAPRQAGVRVVVGDRTFSVEVAATPEQRRTGLMNRTSLPADTGMLFLFPAPTQTGFWMKNTLIPLDIAFISDGRVVEVRTMTPCTTDPCPLTVPGRRYEQALEVGAGNLASVGPGDRVEVRGALPTPS